MFRSHHSVEDKLLAIQQFEEGIYTIAEICSHFSINKETLHVWKIKYDLDGLDGLKPTTSNQYYPKELKQLAVEDYLSGEITILEALKKYRISSTSVFKKWLKPYTGHSELTDSSKGMSQAMTKGRKTTFDERIRIVKACIANKKNYQETAQHYTVSYQQVYQWVKKFEIEGEQGLQDRRGHRKPTKELTTEEKLRLEIQHIKLANERLHAENLFLKKLEEIERRHH